MTMWLWEPGMPTTVSTNSPSTNARIVALLQMAIYRRVGGERDGERRVRRGGGRR